MPKDRSLLDCLKCAIDHAQPGKIHMVITQPRGDMRELLGARMDMITNDIGGAMVKIRRIKEAAEAGDLARVKELLAAEDIPCTS